MGRDNVGEHSTAFLEKHVENAEHIRSISGMLQTSRGKKRCDVHHTPA